MLICYKQSNYKIFKSELDFIVAFLFQAESDRGCKTCEDVASVFYQPLEQFENSSVLCKKEETPHIEERQS